MYLNKEEFLRANYSNLLTFKNTFIVLNILVTSI